MIILLGILSLLLLVLLSVLIARKSSLRENLVALLVVSVLLLPRVPIGNISTNQRIDLRFDDPIILIMMMVGLIMVLSGRSTVSYPGYMKFLYAFIVVSFISCFLGPLQNNNSILVSTVFWLRELEYISLAMLIPIFFRTVSSLKKLALVFVGCMAINMAWLVWQLSLGTYGPMFEIVEVGRYGVGLVSEGQVAIVAAVYSFTLLLSIVYWLANRKSVVSLLFIAAAAVGVIGTLSRGTVYSLPLCLAVLIVLINFGRNSRIKNILISVLALVGGSLATWFALNTFSDAGLYVDRLDFSIAQGALESNRVNRIWRPLFSYFLEQPISGYGKGHIGQLLFTHDEAHNYFLRILVESGIFAATFFVLFLISMLVVSVKIYLRTSKRELVIVTCGVILVGLNITILAMGNDILNTSAIAIAFYISVGCLNVAWLQERRADSSDNY